MNEILFKTLENGKGLYKLQKATLGSAGFDLVAAILDKKSLKPNETELIPCGFSLELPSSFEAQVRPRSGIALKKSGNSFKYSRDNRLRLQRGDRGYIDKSW